MKANSDVVTKVEGETKTKIRDAKEPDIARILDVVSAMFDYPLLDDADKDFRITFFKAEYGDIILESIPKGVSAMIAGTLQFEDGKDPRYHKRMSPEWFAKIFGAMREANRKWRLTQQRKVIPPSHQLAESSSADNGEVLTQGLERFIETHGHLPLAWPWLAVRVHLEMNELLKVGDAEVEKIERRLINKARGPQAQNVPITPEEREQLKSRVQREINIEVLRQHYDTKPPKIMDFRAENPNRMKIKQVEIEGHGTFDVKSDMTHRPRCYIQLHTKEMKFQAVQFNDLNRNNPDFQKGYDNDGVEIQIKITKHT